MHADVMKPCRAVSPGLHLRQDMETPEPLPLIGVYDLFSASIAARQFRGLFVSGFSFAASFYGLPDIGFIAWSDMLAFVQRLRTVLPEHHLVVDIDDGYCDTEVACHVVRQLHALGASAVVLEDQRRPRRCGHLDGKQLLEPAEYLQKLQRVLACRSDLVVVARTDATEAEDAAQRAMAYAAVGADAVLVEAVKDLALLKELQQQVGVPLMFNQIAGGKSPPFTLAELREAGVSLVNYSTPCLFAAQTALEQCMTDLKRSGGQLSYGGPGQIGVAECNRLLHQNLQGLQIPRE